MSGDSAWPMTAVSVPTSLNAPKPGGIPSLATQGELVTWGLGQPTFPLAESCSAGLVVAVVVAGQLEVLSGAGKGAELTTPGREAP